MVHQPGKKTRGELPHQQKLHIWADEAVRILRDEVAMEYGGYITYTQLAEHIPQVARTVAKGWLDSITPTELQQALREKPSIPQDVDRSLLQDLTTKSGDANHVLSYDLKVQLRAQFWEAVDKAGSCSRRRPP